MISKIRILLIEDDPSDQDIITATLNKGLENVHIVIVDSRKNLKIALKKEKIDLIITDYQLKGFTGVDVLDEVKANNKIIPTIMLTGDLNSDRALEVMNRGVTDFVIKSLKQIRLLPAKISRILALANENDNKNVKTKSNTKTSKANKQLTKDSSQEENQYISAFEDSPIGVAVGDKQGNIIELNEAGAKVVGYTKAGLLGKNFMEILHPNDRDETRKNFNELFSGTKNGYQLERRYLHKKGKVIWCDISVSLIRDVDGHPHHAIVQAKDITARKLAEEKTRGLLDSAPDAIVVSNEAGRIEIINKQAEQLFGYAREEIIDQKIGILLPKQYRKKHLAFRKKYLANPTGLKMNGMDQGIMGLDKQGREFPVNVSLSIFETDNGRYVSASVRDISEQKRLLNALRESQENFSTAFRCSPDAISISSVASGEFIEINDRFLEMGGFSRDEIIGHSVFELNIWIHQEQLDEMIEELKKDGSLRNFESEYQKKNGETIYCQSSTELIDFNEEQCILIVTRDISEKKKTELELLSYEQIVSSAREYMSIIDHNYNYISVNQYYLDQFEKNRDEIVGHTIDELYGKETFEKEIKKDIDRALAGDHINFKRWIEIPKGKRYVDTEYSPYIDPKGAVGGVVVSSRDITKRYLAEQEQEESEKKFRNLIEGSLQGIFVHRDFKPLFANQKCADIFGFKDPNEILELESILSVFWMPVERDRINNYNIKRKQAANVAEIYESQGRRKDGTEFCFESHVTVVDWHGEKAIQAAVIDISERKRIEKDLQESEERFRSSFEFGPLGMGIGDKEGNILQINNALCEISGWTEEELVGKNFVDFIHPDDIEKSINKLYQLFKGGIDHYRQTRRYLHKRGHYLWVDINVSVINDAEGNPNLLINHLQDVNDRILSESLQETQHKILESIVSGVSQKEILDDLCLMFESLAPPDAKAAIFLLNVDENKLSISAAPSLPDMFLNASDGFIVGEGNASCGTAAFRKEPVIIEDVSTSLLWNGLQDFALKNNIIASWSTPFLSEDGDVLGTFVITLPRPTTASKHDLEHLKMAGSLASIVVERTRSMESLRISEDKFSKSFLSNPASMTLSRLSDGTFLEVNDAFEELTGYSREQAIDESTFNLNIYKNPDDRKRLIEKLKIDSTVKNFEVEIQTRKGEIKFIQFSAELVRIGNEELILGTQIDITDRKHLEDLKTNRAQMLESLAKNQPLDQILQMVTTSSIQLIPDMSASILLINKAGTQLNHAASHGLPDSYTDTLYNLEFWDGAGSCGTAAATGKRVVVTDIHNHPYWANYLELAKKAGIRACWSEPIISSQGKVLGAFALYYKDVREPTETEIEIIENQTNLAAIAIERTQDEEELRESEAKFRSAFGNAPMGTALVSKDGVVLQANTRSKDIIGFTSEEIIGKSILEVSHPDDKIVSVEKFTELMTSKIDSYQLEKRYKHKQGGYVWCRLSISSVPGTDKKPMYAIAHIEDITERQLADEKLRNSEEKYRAIFETSQVGMTLCTMEGAFLDNNQSYLDIIGYSEEEALKLSYWDITPHEYAADEASQLQSLAETGQYGPYEKEYIHKDGHRIPVLLNGSIIKGDDGKENIWSIVQDISERKQAELAITRSHRSLKVLNECNHALVHTEDLQELLDNICRIITEIGGYSMAWIGYAVSDETKSIYKIAQAGYYEDYVSYCKVSWGDNEFGQGPVGKAIRNGERYIIRDIENDSSFEPWKDAALERGYRSEIIFPLKAGIESFGVLAIYSNEIDSFANEEEETLLTHLSENLSYGILSLQSKYEQTKAENSLLQSEHKYHAIYDENPAIFFTVDVNGVVVSVNKFAAEKFGYNVEDMIGTSIFTLCHQDDIDETQRQHKHCFDNPDKIHTWESRRIQKNGNDFWIRETVRVSTDSNGEAILLIVSDDISEAHLLSKELSYQASHDALTKLVNRREFEHRVERLLDSTRQEHSHHALCYMDLDQFKIVNDSCGHTAGDEMLRQLSKELTKSMRHRDTLARLGGDEFGVLMEHCSLNDAHRVAKSIQRIVQDFKFIWEGRIFKIGVSIGLVEITDTTRDLSDLLKVADAACYMAKDKGRNRIHIYHNEDSDIAKRHGEMQWVERLNQALESDWFSLYAQAIVPLDDSTDTHYELLLRMTDDQGKTYSPGVFLPAAERYNLMSKIDCWVVDNAITLMAKNTNFINQVQFCSINLSGQSLSSPEVLNFIINKIDETAIDGEKICFEITETAAITNLVSAMKFISTLKGMGCRFALDDFGSGLSSFGYLKNLPVHYIKIDGMFVKDILDNQIDRAMVKSINEIGQVMGMATIAEFVENDEIKGMLREIGVNYAQGYGIGKPQPLKDLFERANNITDIRHAKKTISGN